MLSLSHVSSSQLLCGGAGANLNHRHLSMYMYRNPGEVHVSGVISELSEPTAEMERMVDRRQTLHGSQVRTVRSVVKHPRSLSVVQLSYSALRSLGWTWHTRYTKRNGLRCLEAGARCRRTGENAAPVAASAGSANVSASSSSWYGASSSNGTSTSSSSCRRTGVRTRASRRSASADDKATAQTPPLTRERTGRGTHAGVS